jgi:UDP-3-O-[3-hydroxymyristoyl] glucosamine N-acyltransferase
MKMNLKKILEETSANWVNRDLLIEKDAENFRIQKPARLMDSCPGELAFFFDKAYLMELEAASPSVLLIGQKFLSIVKEVPAIWEHSAVIASEQPYLAMAKILELFAEGQLRSAHFPRSEQSGEVHSSAQMASSVKLGPGVQIGAHCVLEEGVSIGARSVLYPGCYLGPGVSLGEDAVLFPRVTVYERTKIGDRVRIHAGTVIAADGFGYAQEKTPEGIVHRKIHHLGGVLIEDDVEVGANTCIDRGTVGDTWIGKGAKIDNQVQVGHNAKVGRGAILCGASGLSGSAELGDFAYLGGQAGINNKVKVGVGAQVAAYTPVSKDVAPGVIVAGNPQREHREHFKVHALLNRLASGRRKK